MFQNVSIVELYSICVFLPFMIYAFQKTDGRRTMDRMFRMMYWAVLARLVCDFVSDLANGRPGEFNHLFVQISSASTFLAGYLILMAFTFYLYSYVEGKVGDVPPRTCVIVTALFLGLSVLILLVSQVNGMLFYVDADNTYHRGAAFALFPVAMIVATLSDMAFLYRYRHVMNTRALVSFAAYMAIPAVGMLLQLVVTLPTIDIGFVVSCFLMYANVQSERFDEERLAKEVALAKAADSTRLFVDTLKTVYQRAISLNLTTGTFNYLFDMSDGRPAGWENRETILDEWGSYMARIHPADRGDFKVLSPELLLRAFSRGESSVTAQYRECTSSGVYHWMEAHAQKMTNLRNNDQTAVLLVRIIDERKAEDAEKLRLEEEHHRTVLLGQLLGSNFESAFTIHMEGDTGTVTFLHMPDDKDITVGQSPAYDVMMARYIERFVAREDAERVRREFSTERVLEGLESDGVYSANLLGLRRGSYRWSNWRFLRLPGDDMTILVRVIDIDDRVRADEEKQKRDSLLAGFAQTAFDAETIINLADMTYQEINFRDEDLLGLAPDGDYRESFKDFVKNQTQEQYVKALTDFHSPEGLLRLYRETENGDTASAKLPSVLYAVRHGDGWRYVQSLVYVSPERNQMVYILNRDITTEKIARERETEYQQRLYESAKDLQESYLRESKLRAAAETDALTGMKNETSFQQEVVGRIARLNADGCGIFVMIDGDHFKDINDTYGHAVGDEMIRLLGSSIQGRLRFYDVAARLHGDEFAMYLESPCTFDAAGKIIEAINRTLAEESERLGRPAISITAGFAQAHAGDYYDELFNKADQALYRAKSVRRGSYAY